MNTIAKTALLRLAEGNQRYLASKSELASSTGTEQRVSVVNSQQPFAIVLGCSDSRVPVEVIFDQGLGDLFVVRVAGNIVSPAVTGSVEYSAAHHGAKLIVVLGHTGCGAVEATVNEMDTPSDTLSPNLAEIVEHIRPSVPNVSNDDAPMARDERLDQTELENIRASMAQLQSSSELLRRLVTDEGLCIVGARYSLENGIVEFLDANAL